jgi:hypothetical protein
MTTADSRSDAPGDRGAALILAIGFVVMIGAICAGLAALVTSSLGNRVSLEALRDRQYAAESAVEEAITSIRLTDRTTPPVCGFTSALNGVAVRVDCADAYGVVADPGNDVLGQRNVIFWACVDTGAPCATERALVRAVVNFEQRYAGAVTMTYVQSWSVQS